MIIRNIGKPYCSTAGTPQVSGVCVLMIVRTLHRRRRGLVRLPASARPAASAHSDPPPALPARGPCAARRKGTTPRPARRLDAGTGRSGPSGGARVSLPAAAPLLPSLVSGCPPDWMRHAKPRYHHRAALAESRAAPVTKPPGIHLRRCPAVLRPAGLNGVAGTVTGTAEARGGMIPDPARIPSCQLVRVPLRVPADTGNPRTRRTRRQCPE